MSQGNALLQIFLKFWDANEEFFLKFLSISIFKLLIEI